MIPLLRRIAASLFVALLLAAVGTDALLRRAMGPPPPPPPPRAPPLGGVPPIVPVGGVLLLVSLGSALVVAWPLTRRLRALERAVGALAEGDFDHRVEGPLDDALGAVAAAHARTAAQLRRMFDERDELLQAVSHELGTPLSRMRFHVEALSRAETLEAAQARARAIDNEVRELDELSTELVNWVDADAARLTMADFAPAPGLDAMLELARETSTRPVDTALDAPEGITVRGERRLFERAVENLVRNALRHARGRVRVSLAREGGEVAVRVCDDGPGIPSGERARVLLPFVRLDAARTRGAGGVGLGLAITRRIVERHGGRIALGDAPEGGAEVTTWWPAA